MTLSELRHRHPQFTYESYQTEITVAGLRVQFQFRIEPDLVFHPEVTIQGVTREQWEALPAAVREQWVFHLGLAEMPSYWKAAAPRKIVIHAGYLDSMQLAWWHNLFMQGMGEFFYVNQIEFTDPEFLTITSEAPHPSAENEITPWSFTPETPYVLPIAGGKDSTLSLCLLDEHRLEYGAFLLNPTQAALEVTKRAHARATHTATRVIDPKLLALNEAGYLNGHVPFSAYLAFLSRFVGILFKYGSVVISNERSSNEGNVRYLDHDINHQYSKTFAFERSFEQYLHQTKLIPSREQADAAPAFFSLLRPLYELQISKLLTECSQFDTFAPVIRSCNRGQKTNSWCGQCPKCLFTFTSLYPFIPEEKLLSMFGKNLFDDAQLFDEASALLGVTDAKPFECVGTHEENKVAFYLSCKKITDAGQELPPLLKLVWDAVLTHEEDLDQRATQILHGWNNEHQVPTTLVEMLHDALRRA